MANVASVYARGLYNVAKEKKALSQVASDLKSFYDICLASADLRKGLFSSLFDAATRQDLAEEIATKLKADGVSVRFVGLLAKKNRLAFLGEVLEQFNRLSDRDAGLVRGELRSAVSFSVDEIRELAKSIGKKIGSEVELNVSVDPSLLGGFVANVGGKTFDSSLRTQLHRMKEICTI